MSDLGGNVYRFGPFLLDQSRGLLFRSPAEVVRLTEKQFKILCLFVDNPRKVFTTEDLLDKFWPEEEVEPNNVTQNITALRKGLGEKPGENKYIETRDGYLFVATVELVAPTDDEAHAGLITFEVWMRGLGQRLAKTFRLFVILTATISIPLFVVWPDWSFVLVCAVQLSVIIFALWYRLGGPTGFKNDLDKNGRLSEDTKKSTGYESASDWIEARDKAIDAIQDYETYWRYLWYSWFLFYGLLFGYGLLVSLGFPELANKGGPGSSPPPLKLWLEVTKNTLNNFNTLIILFCFNVLNKPIPGTSKKPIKEAFWVKGAGLVVVFLIIETGILIVSQWVAPAYTSKVLDVTSSASGLAGGISLALYFGRLQSRFLGPPPWLLITLYSYTAIQPLYVFLRDPQLWAVILLNAALLLKCLLYLYMAWLFQSGRLLFYFVRVRHAYERVEEIDWPIFRRILN